MPMCFLFAMVLKLETAGGPPLVPFFVRCGDFFGKSVAAWSSSLLVLWRLWSLVL